MADTPMPDLRELHGRAEAAPRYGRGLLCGLFAAAAGSLIWLIAYRVTGWQVDVASWLLGLMIGRAVLGGAGNRSSLLLQGYSALLGTLAMLSGHCLVLRETMLARGVPLVQGSYLTLFINTLWNEPGQIMGLWSLLFLALGIFSAWHGAAERG